MKVLIISIFLIVLASSMVQCQSQTFKSYQSISLGFDLYAGYSNIGDFFSFKKRSEDLLMRSALIPTIALSHHFNSKGIVSLKYGYGFIKSSNFDALLGANSVSCRRKLRDSKIDLELQYLVVNSQSYAIELTGAAGLNIIKEKTNCFEDNNYNQFGYGLGLAFQIKKGRYKYIIIRSGFYKIGENLLIGGGVRVPVLSTD
jgi:hypothetical protein